MSKVKEVRFTGSSEIYQKMQFFDRQIIMRFTAQ